MIFSTLDSIICENSSQISGKHLPLYTSLLKNTDEQLDEEIHRSRSGRALKEEISVAGE